MKTDTETKPEIQPKEPVNTLSIEPAAPLVKEKPKEPEGPGIEPATLPKVCPKPSSEHIALDRSGTTTSLKIRNRTSHPAITKAATGDNK